MQDDINNFRFKLAAILWDSRLNKKNGYQDLNWLDDDEDGLNYVQINETTTKAPKPSKSVSMDKKELLHQYIWSIDDQECLE